VSTQNKAREFFGIILVRIDEILSNLEDLFRSPLRIQLQLHFKRDLAKLKQRQQEFSNMQVIKSQSYATSQMQVLNKIF